MGRFIKGIFIIIILSTTIILINKYYNYYNLTVRDSNLGWKVMYKGLNGARDFSVDEKGNFYVAFKDKIQFIDKYGNSFILYEDRSLNISSIEYKDRKLYFASDTRVLALDVESKKVIEVIKDLPNFGDYKESLIRINNNSLFVTVGSATNSGVVGKDNEWLSKSPFTYDITPKDIKLKGKSFGEEKTGAFTPYKTKNIDGQIIPGHFPGNSTIIKVDLNSFKSETFAWGIRNVKGIDFNEKDKLIASVGGMEDRGLRPVKGDVDYIYQIDSNIWYGWPDYSGGDPITSPRFKFEGNKSGQFLLDKHPSSNPPAPYYQHKSVGTLGSIAIDRNGAIDEKGCIYYYDVKDNMVYEVNKIGSVKEKINFTGKSKLASMKFIDNKLVLLDESEGCIYDIFTKQYNNNAVVNQKLDYILLIIVLSCIGILYYYKE